MDGPRIREIVRSRLNRTGMSEKSWQLTAEGSGGLVLRGETVVVPACLRPEVLRRIHDEHFGEVKCVERARSAL